MWQMLKKYGFLILLLVVISELVGPFILATQYPNYNSLTMLISHFGEQNAPTKDIFDSWQIVDGCLFLLTVPAVYHRYVGTSKCYATILAITIALYGIGDCIITGLFSKNARHTPATIFSQLHDTASGVGFLALLIGVLMLFLLTRKEGNLRLSQLFAVIFGLALICMLVYSSKRLPVLRELPVSHRGLWQRLNLFFLYLPLFIIAVRNLFGSDKKINV